MSEKRISIFYQLFPPKPDWSVDSVPDHTGKVVIITGGNRGIGKETARVLLLKDAKVYIATHPEADGQRAVEELKQTTKKNMVFFLKLDLGDLLSVKAAAEEFIFKESELHTLYNNGGVMYSPVEDVTSQGYDLQFGTNVLGHFYFTKLLLPVLTATASNAPENTVRVVNVSSLSHYFGAPEGIRWTTINPGTKSIQKRRKLGSARLYGQSRRGNILFSNELARRYGSEGIVSVSIHPGTDFSCHAGSFLHSIGRLFKYAWFYTFSCKDLTSLTDENSHGAITSLYAGTASAAGGYNGKYLTTWTRLTLPHPKALNPDTEKQLWDWCEDQVRDIGNA